MVGQSALPAPAILQVPLAQNNAYAKLAYFKVSYSANFLVYFLHQIGIYMKRQDKRLLSLYLPTLKLISYLPNILQLCAMNFCHYCFIVMTNLQC